MAYDTFTFSITSMCLILSVILPDKMKRTCNIIFAVLLGIGLMMMLTAFTVWRNEVEIDPNLFDAIAGLGFAGTISGVAGLIPAGCQKLIGHR